MTATEFAAWVKQPTRESFLLYGDSGDGKTAQAGEFAEWVFAKSGGRIKDGKAIGGLRARLYNSDLGGWKTVQPQVDLGIIEVVDCYGMPYPWVWFNAIVRGMVPSPKGGWMLDAERNKGIGLYVFDGLTGINDALMLDMQDKAANGVNIGGDGAFKIEDGPLGGAALTSGTLVDFEKQRVAIGSSNRAHYLNAQGMTMKMIGLLSRLPGFKLCTATARRAADSDTTETILGPQVAGKALSSELPRIFTYTFRLTKMVTESGEGTHRLYMAGHKDRSAAGAKAFGNSRVPLAARLLSAEKKLDLPAFIEPANLVKAYEIVTLAEMKARDAVAARLSA